MNRHPKSSFPVLATVAALTAVCGIVPTRASAQPQVFIDGFESPVIDPFWTVREQSGTALTAADNPLNGSRSLKLISTSSGPDKWIWLRKDFSAPVYGRASMWMYDTGADQSSSNYLWMSLYNTDLHRLADFVVFDYDLGPENGGSHYFRPFAPDTNQPVNSFVDRTVAWHRWEVDTRPNSLTLTIDDLVVYSGPVGYPFDQLSIGMSGPSWRPAWTGYFDDFTFVEYCPGQLCDADFNCDGTVTGDDFDSFVTAFVAGIIEADFNSDGFVTGDDFDAYVLGFQAGC